MRLFAVLLGLFLTVHASLFANAHDHLFDYEPFAPPDPEPAAVRQDQVSVITQTFAPYPGDPLHAPLKATLVRPMPASASSPGIVWGHWLGEPATSNRTQYLDEAKAWARDHQATSVLIDNLWSDPHWYPERDLDQDFAHGVQQVILFRRAMDLLLAQPGVDPDRVAFVAHDYSAMYGAIAVAVDQRFKAAVFIAAAPDLLDWAFYSQQPADRDAYLQQNRPLHLPDYLARLSGRPVLVQWAARDFYVPRERQQDFAASLRADKTIKVYDRAGHDMIAPSAIRADRTAWLRQVLKISDR